MARRNCYVVDGVNFFKLYIGDYQRDTAHLSVTEHGAYLLMLQHYYATEKPLPTGKALHRMLRAQDKSEREAIDAVVSAFWRATESGLVNARADAEIGRAAMQAETNRGIALAREAARKAAVGKHGGSTNRATNRATNDQPNQTPDTRHQRERGDTPLKPPAWSPPDWVPAGPWADFVAHRKAMRNVPFTDAARDGVVAELRKLADMGHDPAGLLATAVTRGWRTVFPPRANGAHASGHLVGAMSEHGMQTMRNAEALAARIFKEEAHGA